MSVRMKRLSTSLVIAYTNFAMEAIENVFNGSAGFGRRVTCQISRNGDLIHRIYLQATLPAVTGTTWVDSVGLALVQDVELEIGGQRIDKHYAHWMYIWNELSLPVGKRPGYKNMVGVAGPGEETVYVPLEFWFCRNVGLALPLIALQYHEVKINIDFEQKANLLKAGASSAGDLTATSLWVDYIYLDTDERRRFAQLSHEYLIEQLQFTGDEVVGFNADQTATSRIKLNYNHPTKELVWVLQVDKVSSRGASNNWTAFLNAGSNSPMDKANIQLNGQDRFYVRDANYFQLIQPYQHHENIPVLSAFEAGSKPAGINVYSFALKPEEHQPSGTLNFSRIDTAYLNMTLAKQTGETTSGLTGVAKIYAINYNVLRIMSGMGGLSVANYSCSHNQDQKAAVHSKESSYCGKILCVLSQIIPTPAASVRNQILMQHILLFGKPLTAFSTKCVLETFTWPRVTNSGTLACYTQLSTVIMKRIGQSACLLPNGAMIADGRASETERIWVTNDGLINQRWLKIQSIPLGKLRGRRVLTPTKRRATTHHTVNHTKNHFYSFCLN